MKVIAKTIVVCLFLAASTACSMNTQKHSPTPTTGKSGVSESIFSNVPTITARPVKTPTRSSISGLPMPSQTPYGYWHGIRIMPDAIAGDTIGGGYYFAIDATVEAVQAFYKSEMSDLEWQLTDVEEGTVGNKILIYKKDSQHATISITPQEDGNVYVVINV